MKKLNIIDLFLIILPFIDLTTSITSRFFPEFVSIGMIIKGFAIVLSIIYILFFSASKYRRHTLFTYLAIFIYIISYFIFKNDLLDINYLVNELKYLFKFIYFPIIFFAFLNYYDTHNFDKNKYNKIMLISLFIYILFISIPTIFDVNFKSYTNEAYFGSVGWFYSANEISSILILLIPFIYELIENKKVLAIIIFIISLFTISLIGTKVTLFGLIIITFFAFLIIILKSRKVLAKSTFIAFLFFILTILFMYNNYSILNMQNSYLIEQEESIEISEPDESYFNFKIFGFSLLSNREVYANEVAKIYKETYQNDYFWFGMGFSNTSRISNNNIEKLIEIDFLDIFYHFGIIGLFISFYPLLYVLKLCIKNRKNININIIFPIIIISLTLGISSTAGHVYLAPPVSLYVIVYLIILLNELKVFNKNEINEKKVAILALHMGYGGVENVIASKASMLANDYEVEIISLYKQKISIPYNISKKVKIIYLTNTISNREEFITSLKEFKLIKTIKEGFKSIKILMNKNINIIRYIVNSDAKVIISTRYEFSKLLNKFKRDNVIAIHEQHVFNISHEYIKELDKLKYIDYIMPVSKQLENNYKLKMQNNQKIKYIPLSLNYFPNDSELASLNKKIIIAIGRLEKVKGFKDLIHIMKSINEYDKDINLYIFGDGKERQELEELINKYNLNNNVKLFGFKNQIYIKKYLQNASLYAMTSLEESFGLSVLEAMSYGIPCIAYDSAQGVLDFVNEDNGFIISGRNEKEYVDQIQRYFSLSITERKNMGLNATESSKKYNFKNVQKEWLEFLKNIVNKTLENNYIMDKLKKIYNNDKIFYFKELQNNLKLKEKKFIITVNPEIIMQSKNDFVIKDIFDNNYSFVPDGIAIVNACKLLNILVNERIAGIEIAEFLLKEANNKKYSIYLFGAEDKVLNDLVKIINENYPFIKILGYRNGYVNDKEKVMQEIINLKPDICMVALGVPNQEKIIHKYYKKASKGIFIGVGGSFDVLSGNKRRAPKIFIKLNLEWFYRIFKEPFRIKRFLKYNIKFYLEVMKIKKKNNE